MADNTKYDLGSDWSWDEIDRGGWNEDRKGQLVEKFKHMQRGATKQAEENAALRRQLDEQQKQVEWAHRWQTWTAQKKPLLEQWGAIEEVVQKAGGVEALRQRAFAQAPTADTVTTAAAQARKSLSDRWQNREISLEDMQTGLQEIDEHQAQLQAQMQAQIPRVRDELRVEVAQQLGQMQNQLTEHQQRTQGNSAGSVQFTLAATQYHHRYPDRDLMEIYRTASRHGIGDFNQAAAITYGQQDLEDTVNRRVEEKLALDRENLATQHRAQESSPEGSGMGQMVGSSWRRPRTAQTPHALAGAGMQQPNTPPPAVTKDPAEMDRRILETLLHGKRTPA